MQIKPLLYKQIFWRGVSIATLFLLNILFARFFAASASGTVFYLFTVFTFIIRAVSFSLESGIAYYAARDTIPVGKLAGFSLGWSILASAVVAVVYVPVVTLANAPMNYPLTYPIVFILGNMLISFGNAIYYSRLSFITPNAIAAALNIVLIFFLIANRQDRFAYDFIDLYFYSFLFHGILLFIILAVETRKTHFSFILSRVDLKNIFRYSALAFIANLLTLLLTRIDYLFVKVYCSASDLGNYIQVSKIAQLFLVLPSMIATVLFPVVASGTSPEIYRQDPKSVAVSLLAYAIICLLMLLPGEILFTTIYGESFDKMYMPFLLLIPGILAISGQYPYSAYFAGRNRILVNIVACGCGFVVVLVADIMLIPAYGIRGAAVASSLGYLTTYFYLASVFGKEKLIADEE